MFKKSSEMVREIKDNMRGGKGEIELTHIFMQNELKGKARLFARITINPGCSIGLHEHVNASDAIINVAERPGLFPVAPDRYRSTIGSLGNFSA